MKVLLDENLPHRFAPNCPDPDAQSSEKIPTTAVSVAFEWIGCKDWPHFRRASYKCYDMRKGDSWLFQPPSQDRPAVNRSGNSLSEPRNSSPESGWSDWRWSSTVGRLFSPMISIPTNTKCTRPLCRRAFQARRHPQAFFPRYPAMRFVHRLISL
jgi:hypothetical protein